jgi:TRAP-type C4-dicarboxylate transport system permease small subunit
MQLMSSIRSILAPRQLRHIWQHPLEVILCLLLSSVVTVTFAGVVFRYVLHYPLSWSEEVLRFLLSWLALLGAAYAFKMKAHFSLQFVLQRCGRRLEKVISTCVSVALASFLVIFVVKAVELVQDSMTQIAPATELPMAVPYSSAIVGGTLMLYYVVRDAWILLRGRTP